MLPYSLAKTSVEASWLKFVNCTIGQWTIRVSVVSYVIDGGFDFVVNSPHNCFYLGG